MVSLIRPSLTAVQTASTYCYGISQVKKLVIQLRGKERKNLIRTHWTQYYKLTVLMQR